MASSESGGSDSWPGFLSELTKSFLILRDIFGYALPGAVFLSIGVLLKRFSLHDVQYFLEPYNLPVWLAVVLGIGACYVVGHLMAQIAYFLFNTWKWPFSRKLLFWRRKPASVGHQVAATDGTRTETDSAGPGKCAPTQVSVELISLRGTHPELLIELERQSTMTQLRGATGAAMLVGSLVFYFCRTTPPVGWMMGVAGAFLLSVFMFSAMRHLAELTDNTTTAGTQANAADKAAKGLDPASVKKVLEDFISAANEALKRL
jgi:hypothetical protein